MSAADGARPGFRIEIAPRTIFMVLGVVAAVWLVGQLTTALIVVTVALLLVGTCDPLVAWLEHRGLRRGRALISVFAVAALMLVAFVLLIVPPLVEQFVKLVENAPQTRVRVVASLTGYSWSHPIINALNDLPLDKLSSRAGAILIGYSTRLLMLIGYGISALFLAIYLLADPTGSKGLVYSIVPRRHHVKLAKILLELKLIVGGYMRGQLITSVAISVFVFALLTILGADNALTLALFAGLTDIIPFVGAYVASTPVIIAVTPQGTAVTVVVLVLMVLYQEFESRILVPRVYGRVLRLPPAIVIVALLVGGGLAGIFGALLALPIAAGARMLMRELHVDLPGEASTQDEAREIDDNTAAVYEHLTEGVAPAQAVAVADGLAKAAATADPEAPKVPPLVPRIPKPA
jgi:predicted PurR-regulated permease PerM